MIRLVEDGNCGEVVSIDGVHLGHNFPELDDNMKSVNRYTINLSCVAGLDWFDERQR